jgi:hypothetical protein
MKKIIGLLVLCTCIVLACNTGSDSANLLGNPGEMKAETFSINIDRDTVLQTANGALLKIPKGSLASADKNVKLEIKEAYSIEQMLRAGLTTGFNGAPLSSGGMIFINPAEGQNVSINTPIQVAIPADYLDKEMQLFKGETDANGSVNWKDPVALPENKQLTAIEQGSILFQSKCASCHILGKDMTGPNLAHFMRRFPLTEANLFYYEHWNNSVHDHAAATPATAKESDFQTIQYQYQDQTREKSYYRDHMYAYELYKCNLRQKFNSIGPSFTRTDSTGDESLLDIFRFIQNESNRLNLLLPQHAYLKDCADSCKLYNETVNNLQEQKKNTQQKRKELIKDNGPLVDKEPDSAMPSTNTPPPPDDRKVEPKVYDAEYYQFSISSFGWFNVDALLNNIKGVEESDLFVRVTGDYKERIKIYLVIPSTKTLGEGGPADRNKEEFAFFFKSGKIPLPQNVKAYIIAVTDTKDAPAFGIVEFTTTRSQEIEISLQKGSKEDFNKAIGTLQLDRLHIKVDDAKNADEVRKADTKLETIDNDLKKAEELKPKNCDCDCGAK